METPASSLCRWRVFLLLWTIALCATPVLPQSATTGGLEGLVRDETGKAIPEVEAAIINPASGQLQTVQSDAGGAFRFSLLSPARTR